MITGASSGIGRSMATMLAAEGTDVVVVARDLGRLESLADELASAPGSVEILPADLADAVQLARVAARIQDEAAPIDLLVNNAGLGFTGDFVDIADERAELMVAVNVSALQALSLTAARTMKARKRGTILNVSSLAGDVPGPRSATYNATKAFVTSLSQSLHVELASHGVVVTALCPGLTRTEFQERAEYDTSELPAILWQSADAVAKVGLDAAHAGDAVVVSGLINKAASRLARSAPRSLTRWSAVALNRK